MPYIKTTWENRKTKLNASNMNNIETGITESKAAAVDASAQATLAQITADSKQDIITDLSTIRANATSAIQPGDNISELANDAGYLTTHQSLTDYRKAAAQDVIDADIKVDIADTKSDLAVIQGDYLKAADKTELQNNINTKQDIISDLATIRSGAEAGATAVQPAAIADMATKTEVAATYATQAALAQEIGDREAADDELNNSKQDVISDIEEIRSKAYSALQEHQDISGKVDKPVEPVAGQGVNVPYYFNVNYSADKATVTDYTVDLLDNTKEPQQFSLDINSATTETAGLLSAADKDKLDRAITEHQDLSAYAKSADVANTYATKTELNTKQDIISDITDIRDKANSAVQPATLANYSTTAQMNTAIEAYHDSSKQDVLAAGSNISITDGIISATDTTYQGGLGIDLTGNTFSLPGTLYDGATAGRTAVQPGDNVSVLTNNVGYLTEHQSLDNYYTKSDVDTKVSAKQDIISDLNAIRLGAALGSSAVQPATLEDYSTTEQMNSAIDAHHDSTKQDKLTAGTNITIDDNNVISAADTTYTAGNGIAITNKQISVNIAENDGLKFDADGKLNIDDTVFATCDDVQTTVATAFDTLNTNKQNKLTASTGINIDANSKISVDASEISYPDLADKLAAGTNITIEDNTISATDTTYTAGANINIVGDVISATDTTYSEATTSVAGLESVADKTKLDSLSTVSVSATGTTTDEVGYITVAGIEYKLAGGSGGTSDFNELLNRPSYNGTTMTSATNIPEVKTAVWDAKQEALTAGNNIQINDDVISATNTTYIAGTGIAINNDEISVDTTTIVTAEALDERTAEIGEAVTEQLDLKQNIIKAGTNISIASDKKTISATDTKYSAGDGLTLTDTTFAVDTGKGLDVIDSKVKVRLVGGDTGSSGLQFNEAGAIGVNTDIVQSKLTVNPATTTSTLSGLTIDGTSYAIGGGSGTSNFNDLTNRPSYNGTAMTGSTDIPEVKTSTWDGKQDAISDIETIRSGAALGTTSIQPNDNVSELNNDAGYLTSHQSLSNYYTKTETDSAISAYHDSTKQDTLTAGDNITITEDNVISATDTKYYAGDGISITADNKIVNSGSGATYTAGDGINIATSGSSNVISATNAVVFSATLSGGTSITLDGENQFQSVYDSAINYPTYIYVAGANTLLFRAEVDSTDLVCHATLPIYEDSVAVGITHYHMRMSGATPSSTADYTTNTDYFEVVFTANQSSGAGTSVTLTTGTLEDIYDEFIAGKTVKLRVTDVNPVRTLTCTYASFVNNYYSVSFNSIYVPCSAGSAPTSLTVYTVSRSAASSTQTELFSFEKTINFDT